VLVGHEQHRDVARDAAADAALIVRAARAHPSPVRFERAKDPSAFVSR